MMIVVSVSPCSARDSVGIRVHRATTPGKAVRTARRVNADLAVVTDHLENAEGYFGARSLAPIPTVVCSDRFTSTTIFRAVAGGAYDCVGKPLEVEALQSLVNRLRQEQVDIDEPGKTEEDATADLGDVILGRSTKIIEAYRTAAAAAGTGATVLVRGASGTCKELLARAIHDASAGSGAFVALSCAAIVNSLAESELLGHERGAYTGATERRPGGFETADRATLFLDEIGDATPAFQAKLLRALDRG